MHKHMGLGAAFVIAAFLVCSAQQARAAHPLTPKYLKIIEQTGVQYEKYVDKLCPWAVQIVETYANFSTSAARRLSKVYIGIVRTTADAKIRYINSLAKIGKKIDPASEADYDVAVFNATVQIEAARDACVADIQAVTP